MSRRITIFDTTLRDGEQSPGAALAPEQKLKIALQLKLLGVDVIEAGFPASSPKDLAAVQQIANEVRGPIICGLARALKSDIDACWQAVKDAERPRIHTFLGTSDLHVIEKLGKTHDEVYQMACDAVAYARTLCKDVEFSAEDAMRTDPEYLMKVVEGVIRAGATTVNIPDTVGYTMSWVMAERIKQLLEQVPNIADATISVHCHNDLGCATANSLAAVLAGAGQVECTINGLGERAGNAALEEIVMALKTRQDLFGCNTGVDTRQISRTSRMVSTNTGFIVQPNKAIVGANAFRHEAGIHQHGVLKNRETYEIMDPKSVGLSGEGGLTLGPRSGKAGVMRRLKELGYEVPEDQVEGIYACYLDMADRKRSVYDEDLHLLMSDGDAQIGIWHLGSFISASGAIPTASVSLIKDGKHFTGAATGNGQASAAFKAISDIVGIQPEVEDYHVHNLTAGGDSYGEATVRLRQNGFEAVGRAAATDVIEASARAYLNAINRLIIMGEGGEKAQGC